MDYKARIEDIARRDGITIGYEELSILDSYSQVQTRYLGLAPWSDDPKRQHQQYWIALHEMGHVATTDPTYDPRFIAMFGDGSQIVDIEADAWEWAIRENGGQLDEVGKTVIDAAMGTYTADFGPGTERTQQISQKVNGTGAFTWRRRSEILDLLA